MHDYAKVKFAKENMSIDGRNNMRAHRLVLALSALEDLYEGEVYPDVPEAQDDLQWLLTDIALREARELRDDLEQAATKHVLAEAAE